MAPRISPPTPPVQCRVPSGAPFGSPVLSSPASTMSNGIRGANGPQFVIMPSIADLVAHVSAQESHSCVQIQSFSSIHCLFSPLPGSLYELSLNFINQWHAFLLMHQRSMSCTRCYWHDLGSNDDPSRRWSRATRICGLFPLPRGCGERFKWVAFLFGCALSVEVPFFV
jgi:hypothetical protein